MHREKLTRSNINTVCIFEIARRSSSRTVKRTRLTARLLPDLDITHINSGRWAGFSFGKISHEHKQTQESRGAEKHSIWKFECILICCLVVFKSFFRVQRFFLPPPFAADVKVERTLRSLVNKLLLHIFSAHFKINKRWSEGNARTENCIEEWKCCCCVISPFIEL